MQDLFLYLFAECVPVENIALLKTAAVQDSPVIPFHLFCRCTAVLTAVWTSCTNTVRSDRQRDLWVVLLKVQQRLCHMFGKVCTVTMPAEKAGTQPVMGAEFIRLHLFL